MRSFFAFRNKSRITRHLRDLREAKAETYGQPTLTLQQVKEELDD